MVHTPKSKLAGCILLTGGDVVDKVYIHHASDPLSDGYAHTAFGVYLYYQHNNDLKAAALKRPRCCWIWITKTTRRRNAIATRQWDCHILNANVVELKPVQVDTVKIDCKLPVESLNEVAAWIKGQIGTAPVKYSIVQATLAFVVRWPAVVCV